MTDVVIPGKEAPEPPKDADYWRKQFGLLLDEFLQEKMGGTLTGEQVQGLYVALATAKENIRALLVDMGQPMKAVDKALEESALAFRASRRKAPKVTLG